MRSLNIVARKPSNRITPLWPCAKSWSCRPGLEPDSPATGPVPTRHRSPVASAPGTPSSASSGIAGCRAPSRWTPPPQQPLIQEHQHPLQPRQQHLLQHRPQPAGPPQSTPNRGLLRSPSPTPDGTTAGFGPAAMSGRAAVDLRSSWTAITCSSSCGTSRPTRRGPRWWPIHAIIPGRATAAMAPGMPILS